MAEIRHPPVEVGSFSHYLQGLYTSQVVQDFFHQLYQAWRVMTFSEPWIRSNLGTSQQPLNTAIYGEKGIFAVLAVFWYEGAPNILYKSKDKGIQTLWGHSLWRLSFGASPHISPTTVHNRCVQSAGGQHCDRFSIAGLQEIEAIGAVTMKCPAGKDEGETVQGSRSLTGRGLMVWPLSLVIGMDKCRTSWRPCAFMPYLCTEKM